MHEFLVNEFWKNPGKKNYDFIHVHLSFVLIMLQSQVVLLAHNSIPFWLLHSNTSPFLNPISDSWGGD
jgi:hypothetical protein